MSRTIGDLMMDILNDHGVLTDAEPREIRAVVHAGLTELASKGDPLAIVGLKALRGEL